MSGLMRAIRCASWRAGRCVGMTLLMSVGFVFYFMLLDGTSFTLMNIVGRFPQMVVFVGSLMYLIFGMVDIVTYVQYAMSCGCTRKNTLLSALYMHMFELAVTELVLAVYYLVLPAGWSMVSGREMCMTVLYLFLFDMGLSLTMGIVIKRFGKVAYILLVLLCSAAGGIVGGLVGFFGTAVFDIMIPHASLVVPAAAFAWYGFMAVIFWMFIRKMEVRV